MKLVVASVPFAHGIIGAGGEIKWPGPTRPGEALLFIVGLRSGHGVGDVLEHVLETGEVALFHCCAAGLVIDGSGDLLPIELVAGIAGDAVPEQSAGSSVALPKRVRIIELVVVV